MVERGSRGTPPSERPSSTPPVDLYPTSDIRFVLVEIGKLTTKVDRLISDTSAQGDKIDAVRHQISFVRGALWVIGGAIALAATLGTLYLKWQPTQLPSPAGVHESAPVVPSQSPPNQR